MSVRDIIRQLNYFSSTAIWISRVRKCSVDQGHEGCDVQSRDQTLKAMEASSLKIKDAVYYKVSKIFICSTRIRGSHVINLEKQRISKTMVFTQISELNSLILFILFLTRFEDQ